MSMSGRRVRHELTYVDRKFMRVLSTGSAVRSELRNTNRHVLYEPT